MMVRDPDLELNSSLRRLRKEAGRLIWNRTVQYGHQHPHVAVEIQTGQIDGAFGVLGGRVAGGGCAARHRDHVFHRREGRSLPALIRVTLQKAKETPEEASVATGDKVQTP